LKVSLLKEFSNKKQIAVLVDPEKCQLEEELIQLIDAINIACVNFIFVGGSTVTQSEFEFTLNILKKYAFAPIIIFPGSSEQFSPKADGILFLSLLSGRNPDFLIGHHVQAAQKIADSGIEVLPTAYLLIDGGVRSSVAYVSQTTPIPRDKISIVKNTALAGKLQGKQLLFLDAGSGAKYSISPSMISSLRELDLPIIVGGGISSIEEIKDLHQAGANIVVIGNKIEEDVNFLLDIRNYIQTTNDNLKGSHTKHK